VPNLRDDDDGDCDDNDYGHGSTELFFVLVDHRVLTTIIWRVLHS
jgi:hypothetical protein